MPFIEWDDRMSVGVTLIDDEHKYLVQLANELAEIVETGASEAPVDRYLNKLISFTQSHFAHEEELFTKTPYPDAHGHIEEHEKLRTFLLSLHEKHAKMSSKDFMVQLFIFVKELFMLHALHVDRGYVSYLKEAGFK